MCWMVIDLSWPQEKKNYNTGTDLRDMMVAVLCWTTINSRRSREDAGLRDSCNTKSYFILVTKILFLYFLSFLCFSFFRSIMYYYIIIIIIIYGFVKKYAIKKSYDSLYNILQIYKLYYNNLHYKKA